MWEDVQAKQHPVHPPADPQRHQALPLQLLWQEIPPEVRHEETHVHTHRSATRIKINHSIMKILFRLSYQLIIELIVNQSDNPFILI